MQNAFLGVRTDTINIPDTLDLSAKVLPSPRAVQMVLTCDFLFIGAVNEEGMENARMERLCHEIPLRLREERSSSSQPVSNLRHLREPLDGYYPG